MRTFVSLKFSRLRLNDSSDIRWIFFARYLTISSYDQNFSSTGHHLGDKIFPNGASRAYPINLRKAQNAFDCILFSNAIWFHSETFLFGVPSVRKKALSRSNPPFPSSQKLMKEESPRSPFPTSTSLSLSFLSRDWTQSLSQTTQPAWAN